jgi:hypothetical protein
VRPPAGFVRGKFGWEKPSEMRKEGMRRQRGSERMSAMRQEARSRYEGGARGSSEGSRALSDASPSHGSFDQQIEKRREFEHSWPRIV